MRGLFLSLLFVSTTTFAQPMATHRSNDIFAQMMSNPNAAKSFQEIQWLLLNTRGDTSFIQFFKSNPQLSTIFNYVRTELNASLDEFSNHAKVSMLKLGPELPGQYRLIDKIVKELAQNLGFSQTAIHHREVYLALGGMNAFTVSGNQNRIIVVLQSDLVEKMNLQEIKAVLAHEMGHIRSMHTSLGVMYGLLFDLVAEQFGIEAFPEQGGHYFKCSAHNVFESDKSYLSQTTAIFRNVQNSLAQIEPEQKAELAKTFLKTLLVTLNDSDAPAWTILYFQELSEKIGTHNSIAINAEQFALAGAQAEMAISRSQEKSADKYTSSAVPNLYGGSAFMKLAGIDFDSKTRELFIKQILKSVEEFYATVPEHLQSSYMGTTHPSINLRIYDLLNEESYPAILLANPFLKLLLLEEYIRISSTYNARPGQFNFDQLELERLSSELRKRIADSIASLGLSTKANPRFENAIQYLAFNREALLQNIDTLEGLKDNLPANVTAEQVDEGIQGLKANLNRTNPMAIDILTRLEAELLTLSIGEAEHTLVTQRVKMLKRLLASHKTKQLQKIRKEVTHPKHQDSPKRLNHQVDTDDCSLLLTSPN